MEDEFVDGGVAVAGPLGPSEPSGIGELVPEPNPPEHAAIAAPRRTQPDAAVRTRANLIGAPFALPGRRGLHGAVFICPAERAPSAGSPRRYPPFSVAT